MKGVQTTIICVLAFLLFAFPANAQTETRASKTWEVQKYDITATLPTAETDRFLNAKAILNLKNVSGNPATSLTLRINQNAEVTDVKLNNSTTSFTRGEERIGSGRLQRIILRTISVAPNENVSAEVTYKLKVEENSGLNALSPVGSQFLPLSFWYPTPNSWFFARGADFAPFNLRISLSDNQMVVSSGTGNNNSYEQKLFDQPFFITGQWDIVNSGKVSVFLPKGASSDEQKRANELANLTTEIKNYTTNLLGDAPDFPIRIVAVRRGAGFSGGGTILVDESTFRRPKLDSALVITIAESIAENWFGNIIQVNGDGYGVIRRGLSRFIATQFLEAKYGKEIADVERLRQRMAYAAVIKRDAPLTQVTLLDDYYFATNSYKGAMIWRLLAKRLGNDSFFDIVRANLKIGQINLAELRRSFLQYKELLDYGFDQITDMDLLIGLPQVSGNETKMALRNTGAIEATVEVTATTEKGNKLKTITTIPARGFGEARFNSPDKILRVEVDSEKLFPQTDYANDVKPQEIEDSDLILFIKRAFDRQDFVAAEKNARIVLSDFPRLDDARVFLGRALLAQNKITEAEREFRSVLDEKLPTARSLAWANVGLGEIMLKTNQNTQAVRFFDEAIRINADFGATWQARQGKVKANVTNTGDETVKAFFGQFDKAAVSGNKASIESLIVSGEIPRFSSGIAGQAQEWTTKIVQVNTLDASNILVEVALNIRLINKNPESGTAVYRLTKIGNNWKISGIEMFEVR
jgi:tetratricopeptide (TPR) repeat protein